MADFNHKILEDLIVFGLLMPDVGGGLSVNLASIVTLRSVKSEDSQETGKALLITSIGGEKTWLTSDQAEQLEKKTAQILTLAAGAANNQPKGRILIPRSQ